MPWHERPWADTRDYVALVRRRGWVVVLALLVVTITALVVSLLQTSVYEARARVLAEPPNILGSSRPSASETSAAETEAQLLVSEPVRNLVRNRIGEAPEVVGVPVGRSQVIDVVAQSTQRPRAAEVANAYASAYVDYRRQQTADRLLTATKDVGAEVDELTRQIDGLGTADPRRPALLSQLGVFRAQLDQLQVDAALVGGGPQVLRPATESDRVRPRTGRNLAVASGVGLAFGLALLLLLERLDDSVRTNADVRRAAPGIPLLAVVPPAPEPGLVSRSDPSSRAADAYRRIGASLSAVAGDRPLRTVLVTSPGDGDGTAAVAANLASMQARTDQAVVAVDCNLRRPLLHELFGVPNTVGFTAVLSGEVPLSAALRRVPGEDHLGLLASGPVPPNPSELLASRRAAEVVAGLASQSDWVVVDTPAMGAVTDAAGLAGAVDGVVVVVTAGRTTRTEIADALALLPPSDRQVVGLVVDCADGAGVDRNRGSESPRTPLRPAASNGAGQTPKPAAGAQSRAAHQSETRAGS